MGFSAFLSPCHGLWKVILWNPPLLCSACTGQPSQDLPKITQWETGEGYQGLCWPPGFVLAAPCCSGCGVSRQATPGKRCYCTGWVFADAQMPHSYSGVDSGDSWPLQSWSLAAPGQLCGHAGMTRVGSGGALRPSLPSAVTSRQCLLGFWGLDPPVLAQASHLPHCYSLTVEIAD